jgi:hypothetical protein
MELIEVKVKNILFYAPARGYTILLKPINGDPRTLPVVVGQFEAQAIAMALEDIKLPRPMTHDLLTSALARLTDGLERILISDLKDGTFFAQLLVRKGDGIEEVDARPSDAIAVAIRAKVPIFVETRVFQEAALEMPTDAGKREPEVDRNIDHNLNRIAELARERYDLEQELAKAVVDEDYERAAILRDKLDVLESGSSGPADTRG